MGSVIVLRTVIGAVLTTQSENYLKRGESRRQSRRSMSFLEPVDPA